MSNPPGLGLAAWIDGHWMTDGSLLVPDECEPEDHAESEDGKCYHCRPPAAYLELSFDTAYSYSNPTFGGCGELHRWIIESLGEVCDHFELRWAWFNEFNGQWYLGREGLEDFAAEGAKARDWVNEIVLPALDAMASQKDSAGS